MVDKPISEILDNPDKIYPESRNFGWHDIIGQVVVRGVGATDPNWAQVGNGPMFAYRFAINDACWFCYHVPHDIAPNLPVHLHAHWLSDGVSQNAVTWEWSYMYAKGFDQANFDVAGTIITATQSAAGTAFRHMVAETVPITIQGLSEPDGLIYCRLRRIANVSGADNLDSIFMLTADVHYKSTNMPTINKAPNFYRDSVY